MNYVSHKIYNVYKNFLAEYLYGRCKFKIEWPLFFKFILNEENYFKNRYIKEIKELPKFKKINIKNSKITEKCISNKDLLTNNKNVKKYFFWLKYNANSCRYDVLL